MKNFPLFPYEPVLTPSKRELITYTCALWDTPLAKNKLLHQELYIFYLSFLYDFLCRFRLSPYFSHHHKQQLLIRCHSLAQTIGEEEWLRTLKKNDLPDNSLENSQTAVKMLAFSFGEIMFRPYQSLSTNTRDIMTEKLVRVKSIPSIKPNICNIIDKRIRDLNHHHTFNKVL